MNLQIIKDTDGQDEYVLLPVGVYRALRQQIEEELSDLALQKGQEGDYEPFDPADFVQNPVALARIKAGIKQVELARRMNVSQAYLSKLEHAATVSAGQVKRVMDSISVPATKP
ncbi:MAG: helix-turn-helix transcriptional regulator [Magnetococcales bacterium]|nr:helix-turn-helix transcriptional regulator [Magnetococcales bacterium]